MTTQATENRQATAAMPVQEPPQAQLTQRAAQLQMALRQLVDAMRATLGQSRRTVIAVALGVLSLTGAALVIAQEPAPKATEDSALDRKLDQSRAYVDRMRNMISAGFGELEEARRSQNVARVNCVSDALNTMKGLLRLAESIYLSMQECTSRKDAACAEHEYVKISVAFNKCEDMEGQLKGCGGPSVDGAIDGRPVIEKAVDPDIPDLNPTSGLNDLAPKLDVPPSASPFFKTEGG